MPRSSSKNPPVTDDNTSTSENTSSVLIPPKFSFKQNLICYSHGKYYQVNVKKIARVLDNEPTDTASNPDKTTDESDNENEDELVNMEEITSKDLDRMRKKYAAYLKEQDELKWGDGGTPTYTLLPPARYIYQIKYLDVLVDPTSDTKKNFHQWHYEINLYDPKFDIVKSLGFMQRGTNSFISLDENENEWHIPLTPFVKNFLKEEFRTRRTYKLPAESNAEVILDLFLDARKKHPEQFRIIHNSDDLYNYTSLRPSTALESDDGSSGNDSHKHSSSSSLSPSERLPIYLSDEFIAQEIIDALVFYFDYATNQHYIIFEHEIALKDFLAEEGEAPCNVFGIEHLCRLMACLPNMLKEPFLREIELETVKCLEIILGDLISFMERIWDERKNEYTPGTKASSKKSPKGKKGGKKSKSKQASTPAPSNEDDATPSSQQKGKKRGGTKRKRSPSTSKNSKKAKK